MHQYPVNSLLTDTHPNRIENSGGARLPILVWVVLFFTLLASGVKGQLLGFNVSGISWLMPLIVSVFIMISRLSKVTFPWKLWLPWVLLLIIQLFILDYSLLDFRVSPLQRTAQVLTPLLVGIAVSTYRPSQELLIKFFSVLRFSAYIEFVILVVLSGGMMRGFAAEVMTVLLLSVFFANRYLLFREMKDIQLWIVLAVVPVLAVTRMVIAATLLTFPLAFSPMPVVRRLIFSLLIIVAGIGIFQLPQVQQKMFFSGQGELSDIGRSEDFATSGRFALWEVLYNKAQNEHWTGHGTGAAESVAYFLTFVGYPHNDWLLTYFDYGVLGVGMYAICILLTIWHGFMAQRKTKDKNIRLLFLAGISAFIPFMIVMYTDNIMVYASFFGMLHYTFLGLGYGALKAEQEGQMRSSGKEQEESYKERIRYKFQGARYKKNLEL